MLFRYVHSILKIPEEEECLGLFPRKGYRKQCFRKLFSFASESSPNNALDKINKLNFDLMMLCTYLFRGLVENLALLGLLAVKLLLFVLFGAAFPQGATPCRALNNFSERVLPDANSLYFLLSPF